MRMLYLTVRAKNDLTGDIRLALGPRPSQENRIGRQLPFLGILSGVALSHFLEAECFPDCSEIR
jgi:hypothetical protein